MGISPMSIRASVLVHMPFVHVGRVPCANISGLKIIHRWNKFLFLNWKDFPLWVSALIQLAIVLLPSLDIFNFCFLFKILNHKQENTFRLYKESVVPRISPKCLQLDQWYRNNQSKNSTED